MQSSSPPKAPDPVAVAAAQTQSNKDTAIANANLNRIDQFGPQGNVTYEIVGYNADGTPKYQQKTQYSAGEQQVYDTGLAARQNMGNIAVDQSAKLGGMLNADFKVDDAVQQKLFDLGRSRLDPMFDQRSSALEQQLANKGISMGSEAWNNSMRQFDQGKNDAYNSLALTGRDQAYKEVVYDRSRPFNEFASVMSGSQVANPWLANVPGVNQAGTDVAGITQNAYNQQLQAYNMQNQSNNAMMGGVAGLAGTAMKLLPWSDARLKTDIVRTGNIGPKGLGEVEWTYIWGGPRHRGYIAQEVLQTHPHAVHEIGGYLAIDYAEIV